MASEYIRFPLNNVNDLVIDSEGRIYTESGFWGRLQVYSPNGDFLRGWFSGSCGGACQLELDNDGQVHVYTARGHQHYVYNEMGELISKTDLLETEFYKYEGEVTETVDHLGNRYQIRDRYLFPKVVRITPSDDIDLVIGNPLYLKLFEPTFVVLSVVIALILLSFVERREKRVRKMQKQKRGVATANRGQLSIS